MTTETTTCTLCATTILMVGDERRAHMQIHRAAPELLAALREANTLLNGLRDIQKMDDPEPRTVHGIIRAAIALATRGAS
mgnify:FL=1